jgi:phosphatidylserine decarboxylase
MTRGDLVKSLAGPAMGGELGREQVNLEGLRHGGGETRARDGRASGLVAPPRGLAKCRIASRPEKFYHGGVQNSGKASQAALRLIVWSGMGVGGVLLVAFLAKYLGSFVLGLTDTLIVLWAVFAIFTFYFFRDPDAHTPEGKNLVIAPGHGTVDVIDTTTETEFMGGECQRVSIFLSVFDVHVQNAPLTGRVAYFKHTPGQYLNAMRTDCADFNENVLIGIEAIEPKGEKVGVRLIAGLIARRIVPWVAENDPIRRGERISLIQFGSRAHVYLPRHAKVRVKLGDKVAGGETILAAFD